jgi:hypothetical protein
MRFAKGRRQHALSVGLHLCQVRTEAVRNSLPIAAIALAAALCCSPHRALAQDAQSQSGVTQPQSTESSKEDRAVPADAGNKQEEDSPDAACIRELAASEQAFQDKIEAKALSEADAEKLTQLLDDADAACSEGDVREARQKLETVNETVAKAK